MKTIKFYTGIIFLTFTSMVLGQTVKLRPDLSKVQDSELWEYHNVRTSYQGGILEMQVDGNGGLLILKDVNFSDGTIELDIKGEDKRGGSFLGLAFHGVDEKTYDAIYFRAFNFRSPEKSGNAMQYISHPEHTWYSLRKKDLGKYENNIIPAPDPDNWFHVKVVIKSPKVEVFVNGNNEPSLVVNQLSSRNKGWLAFWADGNSKGNFKNLVIIKE